MEQQACSRPSLHIGMGEAEASQAKLRYMQAGSFSNTTVLLRTLRETFLNFLFELFVDSI